MKYVFNPFTAKFDIVSTATDFVDTFWKLDQTTPQTPVGDWIIHGLKIDDDLTVSLSSNFLFPYVSLMTERGIIIGNSVGNTNNNSHPGATLTLQAGSSQQSGLFRQNGGDILLKPGFGYGIGRNGVVAIGSVPANPVAPFTIVAQAEESTGSNVLALDTNSAIYAGGGPNIPFYHGGVLVGKINASRGAGLADLNFSFTVNGTVPLSLHTSKVGVNTSSPTATLDVDGDAIFNKSGADKDFTVWGTDTTDKALFVDASGNTINFFNTIIGFGKTGVDYTLTFDGETNDGIITWMEDEDYFKFSDDILMNSTENIHFRDTAINIASLDDGHLDLTADVSIDLNGLTLTQNVQPIADDTYYLGKNDDDTPLAYKGVILKDTTNGKYYRVEVISGVVTATDLTD